MSEDKNLSNKFNISDVKVLERNSNININLERNSNLNSFKYMYRMKIQVKSGPCGYIDNEYYYSRLYDSVDELKEKWIDDIPEIEKTRWERSRKMIIQKVEVSEIFPEIDKSSNRTLKEQLNEISRILGSSFDEI